MTDEELARKIEGCRTKEEAVTVYFSGIRAGIGLVPKMNAAIIKKWSFSALQDVKRRAWTAAEKLGL
jgi:hypothetical protein